MTTEANNETLPVVTLGALRHVVNAIEATIQSSGRGVKRELTDRFNELLQLVGDALFNEELGEIGYLPGADETVEKNQLGQASTAIFYQLRELLAEIQAKEKETPKPGEIAPD